MSLKRRFTAATNWYCFSHTKPEICFRVSKLMSGFFCVDAHFFIVAAGNLLSFEGWLFQHCGWFSLFFNTESCSRWWSIFQHCSQRWLFAAGDGAFNIAAGGGIFNTAAAFPFFQLIESCSRWSLFQHCGRWWRIQHRWWRIQRCGCRCREFRHHICYKITQ